jgi:hypothetical protein
MSNYVSMGKHLRQLQDSASRNDAYLKEIRILVESHKKDTQRIGRAY